MRKKHEARSRGLRAGNTWAQSALGQVAELAGHFQAHLLGRFGGLEHLLVDHRLDNRDFDLTGPQALDHDEVAAILSRQTGKAISYEEITAEAMRTQLLGAGLPPAYAEFLLVILGFFKAGYSERTTDAVLKITGQPPRRFEEYARDYRAAWV